MTKKETNLQEAIKKLKKEHGEGVVLDPENKETFHIDVIPTGCYALDKVLGCGGLPRGRILELFGQESSGKSVTSLFLAAQVQRAGGKVAYLDNENAYDKDWAESIGVSTDKLLVSQPETLEATFDIVKAFVETNEIDLIIVDSTAAMVPKQELEGDELLKNSVAVQARLMSKGLRILTGPIARSKTVVIFINQLRDNVGVFYGQKQVTPGGKALKFYSSIRLQVTRGTKIKDEKDECIGNKIYITAVKNKVAPPYKKDEFDLYFTSGFDLHADVFNTAVEMGIIKKSGNTYSHGETQLGVGKEKAKNALKEDDALYKKLRKEIDKKI